MQAIRRRGACFMNQSKNPKLCRNPNPRKISCKPQIPNSGMKFNGWGRRFASWAATTSLMDDDTHDLHAMHAAVTTLWLAPSSAVANDKGKDAAPPLPPDGGVCGMNASRCTERGRRCWPPCHGHLIAEMVAGPPTHPPKLAPKEIMEQ
jgi:hypothetical protein